jgi:hypothetical protein
MEGDIKLGSTLGGSINNLIVAFGDAIKSIPLLPVEQNLVSAAPSDPGLFSGQPIEVAIEATPTLTAWLGRLTAKVSAFAKA